MTVWYRLVERVYATPADENGNPTPGIGRIEVLTQELEVLKETRKGVWLRTYYGEQRWVSRHSRKRYACPTFEEAVDSFMARKQRQRRMLSYRLEVSRRAEAIASTMKGLELKHFIPVISSEG